MTPDCPLINVNALSGLMNLTNIAWWFAIGVGVVCAIILAFKLFDVLKGIPTLLWEIGLYGSSIALIASPFWMESPGEWMKIVGCLLLAGSILFSGMARNVDPNNDAFFGTLLVIYGGLALFYGSEPIGYLAICALLSLVGFSVVSGGLCIAMGYEDEDKLPGGTLVAVLLTAAALGAAFFRVSFGPLEKPHEWEDLGVMGHAAIGLGTAILVGYGANWLSNNMDAVNTYIESIRV